MLHKVACVQMTSTSDVTQNLSAAKKLIQQAVEQQARLVVLPEMFALMGMDQMDKLKQREKIGSGPIQDFLREQSAQHKIWLVGGTIPIAVANNSEKARAACLLFNDHGECVARYDKVHLFDVDLLDVNRRGKQESYRESKIIEPGGEVVVIPTPFGRLGLAVCYDVRFPELFRQMLSKQVEIIVLPTAFTYTTGVAHWDVLVRARAIENLSYVIAACQTGVHVNGRKTYGHSMMVNPWGEVIVSLPQEPGVIVAEIDLEKLHQVRHDFPALAHRRF